MKPDNFPAQITGAVYGVILNDSDSLHRIGAALTEAPYKGAPKAPVLYIKPANTRIGGGAAINLPIGASAVEIGATIGVVIGAPAARVTLKNAAASIAGYVLVADLSLPHASYYRPAIREKCFDNSCVISGDLLPAEKIAKTPALLITTQINGRQVDTWALADLLRSIPELLRDVTEFMTLQRGDLLLVGVKWQAPQAAPGDHVTLTAAGLGELNFRIAAAGGDK
ncbi:fumarylacetoacetate hydrolase family protein [Collimonas sp.]|jgi:5-oxopent-3-ene-1,2,5-tricarboxylate decarboxylase/2-hydroxyhepta-2,4-diene-1,7-dioate isomerase|uniref:fumarylacetoacetate hydrolase family protein n=1 Tax=Collimonas sp. TaxID=1963772 RepID=UPI002BE7D307|nr:fumarylacetoacetate hydrolase family protein [Collimonas sp.]HWW06927.1 fumarylacetoacetate hydrolase family protein [Collimonas sp.]